LLTTEQDILLGEFIYVISLRYLFTSFLIKVVHFEHPMLNRCPECASICPISTTILLYILSTFKHTTDMSPPRNTFDFLAGKGGRRERGDKYSFAS
jgi:hypothetical protein